MEFRPLENLIFEFRKRRTDHAVALFIGAGCSVTGGVPLARKMIENALEEAGSSEDKRAEMLLAGYNVAMRELIDARDYTDRIRKYVTNARVNLAHLCIATLLQERVVDRVITTNFDNLLERGCALLGHSPAVYDCVVLNETAEDALMRESDGAVIHLHGQAFGAKRLNTPGELASVDQITERVLKGVLPQRMVVVVGYGGASDTVKDVFRRLARERFVYWVPHSRSDAEAIQRDFMGQERIRVTVPLREVNGMEEGADPFFAWLLTATNAKLPPSVTDQGVRAKFLDAQINWNSMRHLGIGGSKPDEPVLSKPTQEMETADLPDLVPSPKEPEYAR